MFYRVWNSDAAKWVMDNCKMCKATAMRIADAQEALTGDTHVVVLA